jgi:hypothetical protein
MMSAATTMIRADSTPEPLASGVTPENSVSRAADLFARLENSNRVGLEELIDDREPESLFLDFKRSPNDGVGKQLAPEDSKNLSKAISGFGNSSGGVVIWGVDCHRDPADGVERAKKQPLQDAVGFATKLQSAISRATIPPHSGVQVHAFVESPDSTAGYAAILIPQSLIGPLRSVVKNNYYFRSGSDFGIIPHDVLAGMFGKAPQPSVDMNIAWYPTRLNQRPDHFTLALGLFAVNFGAVISERPYVSIAYGSIASELIVVQAPDPKAFSLRRGLLPVLSVVAHADVVLPPGASEHVCDIIIDIPVSQPHEITIVCTLGVLGAPPHRFRLRASLDAVCEGIERARDGQFPTGDVLHVEQGV